MSTVEHESTIQRLEAEMIEKNERIEDLEQRLVYLENMFRLFRRVMSGKREEDEEEEEYYACEMCGDRCPISESDLCGDRCYACN